MNAIDILSLLTPVTFFAMFALERWRPARRFPPVRGWTWIGVGFLILLGTVSTVVPLLLPGEWLAKHRLMNGTVLGVIPGAIVGYGVYSFVAYLWHRSTHEFSFLWRIAHQMHHSPQRVDIPGSVVFHPIDIGMYTLLQVIASVFVLGLDPLAAALTGYIASFYGMFQHLNMRTPQWLGYFIQRPEAHCLHHQRNVHHYNFADLPLWDMLFGSFRNPPAWQDAAGFEAPIDKKFGAMLAFVDVNAPLYGEGSRGSQQKVAAAQHAVTS